MKVVAPGKLMLFGAYSVLKGSQSLVVAVDRYAVADADRLAPSTSREVRAAIGDEPAAGLDVSALHDGGHKLGLGSSAAALVATLGAREAMRGKDLADETVRRALFMEARRAHARAQGGGSGVDVAASTFGGALFYSVLVADDPFVCPAHLPEELVLRVFWSGTSARTSELVARVKKLEETDRATFDGCIDTLGALAQRLMREHDLSDVIDAGQRNARALAALGRAADAPIVPASFADLAALAEKENAAFYPSGAGGGDVGVWLGADPPSQELIERARTLGMFLLDVGMDRAGVRIRKD